MSPTDFACLDSVSRRTLTGMLREDEGGEFMLKRRTTAKRMRAKLHEICLEVQRRRHRPTPEQGAWLGAVVRGYFAYYAVPTNSDRLEGFRTEVVHTWHRALRRRGQRDRTNWRRMGPSPIDGFLSHASSTLAPEAF